MTNTSKNSNINQGGVSGEQENDTMQNLKHLTVEQVLDWDREVKDHVEKIRQYLFDLENDKAYISPEEKAKIESEADQFLKPLEWMRSDFKGYIQTLERIMPNIHDQEGKE